MDGRRQGGLLRRSDVGVDVVRKWTARLPRDGSVLEIGAGTGTPLAQALIAEGFAVCAIHSGERWNPGKAEQGKRA